MASNNLQGVMRELYRLAAPLPAWSDTQLIDCFVSQRDEAAFAELVRRHGPLVLGVCRRILGNVHDAEDAFQATFLVFVRKARSIRRAERLGNWLYGVAYRTARKAKAGVLRRRAREMLVVEMPPVAAPDEPGWSDLRSVLDEELSRLPERYRLPVILCDLEGRGRSEVAQRLAWAEGTLSSRLARARRLLAERLAGRGIALSAAVLATALGESAAEAALPAPLADSTLRAAMTVAASQAALGSAVSIEVATLTRGVIQAMWMTRVKIAAVMVLGMGVLVGGAGLVSRKSDTAVAQAPAVPAPPAAAPKTAVQRAKELMQKSAGAKIEGVPDPLAKKFDPVYGIKRFQRLLDDALADKKKDEQIIDTLFLAVIARLPRLEESKRLTDYLAKQQAAKADRKTAFAGVLSALVNSAEFVQHVQALNKDTGQDKLQDLLQKLPLRPKGDPNAPGRGPFFGAPEGEAILNRTRGAADAKEPRVFPRADEPDRVKKLIGLLGDKAFPTRQRADDELEKLGAAALPALREAAAGKTDLDTKRRVERLMDRIEFNLVGRVGYGVKRRLERMLQLNPKLDNEQMVKAAYLLSVARAPTEAESAQAVKQLKQAKDRREAVVEIARPLILGRMFCQDVAAANLKMLDFQDKLPPGVQPQVIAMLNGRKTSDLVGDVAGKCVKTTAALSRQEFYDIAFLVTLSRLPTDKEAATLDRIKVKDRNAIAKDLLWALVNCGEFLLKR